MLAMSPLAKIQRCPVCLSVCLSCLYNQQCTKIRITIMQCRKQATTYHKVSLNTIVGSVENTIFTIYKII